MSDYGRFEGLKMVSLFGEWADKRLGLSWRINTYKDGSGTSTTFFPCRSFEDAVEKAKEIIYSKERLLDEDYQFCINYGIPIDQIKNTERIKLNSESKERQILETKKKLEVYKAELAKIVDGDVFKWH